ncbi:hypothetical protein CHUAL_004779 [Chamberlinius hualienensis]
MNAVSVALLFGLVAFAYAGTPTLPGDCPDFKHMTQINAQEVTGDWFVHFCGKKGVDEKNETKKCVKKTVTSKADGFEDTVTYVDGTGKKLTKIVTAKPITGTGKFTLSGDDLTEVPKSVTITGCILDVTDKYIVAAYCGTDGSKHGYKINIYGREKTLAAADAAKAKEAIKSRGITVDLQAVEQNC